MKYITIDEIIESAAIHGNENVLIYDTTKFYES